MSMPADLHQFTFTNKLVTCLATLRDGADEAVIKFGYGNFTIGTWPTFIDMIANNHLPLHEQFNLTNNVKLYLDVERQLDSEPDEVDQKEFLHEIVRTLNKVAGTETDELFVSNGSRPCKGGWKQSFHVTTDKLMNGAAMIKIAQAVNRLLPMKFKKKNDKGHLVGPVDEKVYGHNQCLRTVYSTKPGDDSKEYLKPWHVETFLEIKFETALEKCAWVANSLISNVPTATNNALPCPGARPPKPRVGGPVAIPGLVDAKVLRRQKRVGEPVAIPGLVDVVDSDDDVDSEDEEDEEKELPPVLSYVDLQRAQTLALRVKCDTFEDWSKLGFALGTCFNKSDAGEYFFISLWIGRPMFDMREAKKCYHMANGALGLAYLERAAAAPVHGLFNQEHLLAMTKDLKASIAQCEKSDFIRKARLLQEFEEISICELNKYFVALKDQKQTILEDTQYVEPLQYSAGDLVNFTYKACSMEFKAWIASPARRTCHGIVFNPNFMGDIIDRVGNAHFNLWRGYDYPRTEEVLTDHDLSSIQAYMDHMLNGICVGNQEHFEYLKKWIAHVIQKPGVPTKVGVVLQGANGCGKGILVSKIMEIVGKQSSYHVLDQANGLYSRFTPEGMATATVVYVDEAHFAGSPNDVQLMKKMITEETMEIEKKFGSRRRFENFRNFVFASNSVQVISAAAKERRFFVVKCSDLFSGNSNAETKAYFDKIVATPVKVLAQYFYNVDLTDWNPVEIPQTTALVDQKALSMTAVENWWESCLQTGKVVLLHRIADSSNPPLYQFAERDPVCCAALYEAFSLYHSATRGAQRAVNQATFNAEFKQLLTPRGTNQPLYTNTRPCKDGVRQGRSWTFPSLDKCRQQFAERMDFTAWFDDNASPVRKRQRVSEGPCF